MIKSGIHRLARDHGSLAFTICLFLLSSMACTHRTGADGSGANPIEVRSPGGQLVYYISLQEGSPSYSISFKGRLLVENSRLTLELQGSGGPCKNMVITGHQARPVDETYTLAVGKTAVARNHCNELTVNLEEKSQPGWKLDLIIRAYDEGIAFRYEFPVQEHLDSLELTGEHSTFNLAGNPRALALFLPGYTTSHEGLYTDTPYSDLPEDNLMDIPVSFDFGGTYMTITEAALKEYAGMYLVKHKGMLVSRLSPLPGLEVVKVRAGLPHVSPWRVLLISDRIGDLFESNILTSLNEPCKITETSWMKPGKATWPWWNGTVVEDTEVTAGNNFETNKYYIDFCARNGIEYHSVVEYGGHEWYVNDGEGYQPGTGADVTRPVEGLDMQRVCEYARSKGVGIRLWVHWAALFPKLEEAFTVYQQWGVGGLMIDFMDRDDQEMVNIQNEMVERAAAHHLHVQFHGAYKPTGMHRTWPNEFTREGTLNNEVDKWDTTITPDHDMDIVFTRLLAGPTDYHLGGFRAAAEEDFTVHYVKPLVMGTRCHMLAMYVVLESYLGLVCDYPEAYEGQPGFDFIRRVPTSWDETRVLDAEFDEYMAMARRKGTEWFVGVLNNSIPRQISLPLGFLPPGQYRARISTDSDLSGKNPNLVREETMTLNRGENLSVNLARGGGAVIHLFPGRREN
jgi:alpha-glucosidase